MTALPAGWVGVALGEITDTSLGKMLDAKQATGQHPTPYLRNVNVRWGTFDLSDVATMDIRPEELERVLAREGDVVACEGGEPGRAAVWRHSEPVALQKALHRIRPATGIAPGFLAFVLQAHAASGELAALFTGTTIKHLPQEKLRLVRVPVAPTAEQERIVTAIDEAFSKLDAGDAGLRAARQRLKRMRDSVLAAAVTGQLVPQDPADKPASKLLAELGVESLPEESLPVLPEGWAWVAITAVAARERNALAIGPFGSNLKVSDYTDDGVPLVFVRNIRRKDFQSDLKFVSLSKAAELSTHRVEHGDVLVTKMGDPPGDTAIYSASAPAIITADCIKVTCGPPMNPAFLSLAITAGETRRRLIGETRGVAQKKISLGSFRGLPIPLPPLAEQQRIVEEVDRQLSFIEAAERAVDAGLARSAALRSSVLKAAFEGRLVAQDPADEPASILLERIRAERTASPTRKRRRARATA